MSEGPESIVLTYLRRFDAKIDVLATDMRDVKHRIMAVKIQLADIVSASASPYASRSSRMDRCEERLDRIDRRLDILPAG